MARLVVILSGPVNAGRTTLAEGLARRFGAEVLRTHHILRARFPRRSATRRSLQRAGQELDRETDGRWVADALVEAAAGAPLDALIVLDSVKIHGQIEAIRRAFGPKVRHIHLTAPVETLARRHEGRRTRPGEPEQYAEVQRNATERKVDRVAAEADVVVDTDRTTAEGVLARAAAQLGLYGRSYERLVDVVIGGQWGSEGKGNIVAYLAPEYDVLVRVGGPNAGHKVFAEPEAETYRILPSGTTRNEDALIVIGPGAVLDVEVLRDEINRFEVDAQRLTIDPQAMIIESSDVDAEKDLKRLIGSTGKGVGAATARKITARGLSIRLARDVADLHPFVRHSCDVLDDAFRDGRRILLEGTQGTGLSLHHGSYPYVTSRDTTVGGCLAEAGIAPSRVRRVVMVCRTYPIRVESPAGGTSGDMGPELTLEDVAARSGIALATLQKTERTTTTNRSRRIAEFNWELLRKAASLNGPTDIALTFADYRDIKNKAARRIEQLTRDTLNFVSEVERVACAPASLISVDFNLRNIIDRRSW